MLWYVSACTVLFGLLVGLLLRRFVHKNQKLGVFKSLGWIAVFYVPTLLLAAAAHVALGGPGGGPLIGNASAMGMLALFLVLRFRSGYVPSPIKGGAPDMRKMPDPPAPQAAPATILPADAAHRRPDRQQNRPAESDEELWSRALDEFESDNRRRGLWASVYAEAGGDEASAKAKYLARRHAELKSAQAG